VHEPITSGGIRTQGIGDVGTAAASALATARSTLEAARWLRRGEPAVAAFAPARLDVLGGIADYSGAIVLELPLANGVVAIAQRTTDARLSVMTTGPMAPAVRPVSLPLAVLLDGSPHEAPERLCAALRQMAAAWAAYILGPVAMLVSEDVLPASLIHESGLRLGVWSDVPAGAGISSSAALEVATLRAVQGLYATDLGELTGMQLATLAQVAEQRVALAPCGIMDQATSTFGLHEHLLVLRCQPCEVLGQRPLPPGVRVLGIDSGVAHKVADGQYGRVRAAAFMGRRLIGELAEADGCQEPAGGYLCNLTTARFEEAYAPRLPATMTGEDFLLISRPMMMRRRRSSPIKSTGCVTVRPIPFTRLQMSPRFSPRSTPSR
jgi:L-arabinokinase